MRIRISKKRSLLITERHDVKRARFRRRAGKGIGQVLLATITDIRARIFSLLHIRLPLARRRAGATAEKS